LIGLVLPWLSFKDARNKVEDPIVDTYRSVLASPTVQAIGYALDDATGGHVSALFEGTLFVALLHRFLSPSFLSHVANWDVIYIHV
jgi:hypothetical protein